MTVRFSSTFPTAVFAANNFTKSLLTRGKLTCANFSARDQKEGASTASAAVAQSPNPISRLDKELPAKNRNFSLLFRNIPSLAL